jgi:hypothetical protein
MLLLIIGLSFNNVQSGKSGGVLTCYNNYLLDGCGQLKDSMPPARDFLKDHLEFIVKGTGLEPARDFLWREFDRNFVRKAISLTC